MQLAGGRFLLTASRFALVVDAFGIPPAQVIGLDPDKDYIAIRAEAPANATYTEIMAMLRTLLATRFGLKYHYTEKSGTVYTLSIASGGAKISPLRQDQMSAPAPSFVATQGHLDLKQGAVAVMRFDGEPVIVGQGITARQLCGAFASILRAPVTDSTGLRGRFDIDLRFSSPRGDLGLNPLFEVVRRQLGLRLKRGSGPVKYLVVDHMATRPTPNL